ncbi:DUF2785 domain-containing protein [Pseudoalteromonas sp. C2R02]|uniref:DUF2785 domain-containing protein n=1 Tax=Pseudoalteromonas sp. C2R02 TaxID=2841565 RepID=UPI001C08E853|nr:DUF2785 domain-containing protein [Pseudoalteromonas sp. C2R02]MBU2968177.1 DUF2785 domain-containing protein [Pseudoalteromonas sp. C2R02]
MKNLYLAGMLCLSVNLTVVAAEQNNIKAQEVSQSCLSEHWSKSKLIALKASDFKVDNPREREQLALQMLNCLAHPDPELRDGVAFESLSKWLRGNLLKTEIAIQMLNTLEPVLNTKIDDVNGIYQPFVALVLAELARVDRKSPYLTEYQRSSLLKEAITYLIYQKDYRGFDNKLGWRHGIAHGADLLLQLSLNPKLNKVQLDSILNALSTQIKANNAHFYIYGESKRLAMPLVYIFLRKEHTAKDWQQWIEKVIVPLPLASWSEAYNSQESLAKLHNLQSFLYSLYAIIKNSKNEVLVSMIPDLEKAIKIVR